MDDGRESGAQWWIGVGGEQVGSGDVLLIGCVGRVKVRVLCFVVCVGSVWRHREVVWMVCIEAPIAQW